MVSPFSSEPILDEVIATIDYTQEEWETFLQQFCRAVPYQIWLQQQGVSHEEFETWLKRELAIRKFQHRQWGKKVTSYFLDRKRQLDQIIYSLIQVNDQGLAQELYFRIVEKEATFADLARLYSQGAEALHGGRIGPIELGQVPPPFAALFYGAKPGQLWEPMRMDQAFVIVRLDETLPVQFDEFMRQSLLNELLAAWIKDRSPRQQWH